MESKSRACTSRMVVNPLLGLTLGNVLERFVSKRRIPTGACVSALIPHSKLANRFPFCAWPAIDRRIVGALFKFQRRSTVLYLRDLLSCVLYPRHVKFLLKGARFTKWLIKDWRKAKAKRKKLEKKKKIFSNEIRNNDINRAAQWKNDSSVFFFQNQGKKIWINISWWNYKIVKENFIRIKIKFHRKYTDSDIYLPLEHGSRLESFYFIYVYINSTIM